MALRDTDPKAFYVLSAEPDNCWVLTASSGPMSRARCRHAIAWQNDVAGKWVIAQYNPDADVFEDTAGRTFKPSRGPYTVAAWDRLLSEIKAAHTPPQT